MQSSTSWTGPGRAGSISTQPEVDSDERRTVGIKLQYRILEAFGLTKDRPLDTTILGIAVELKATVAATGLSHGKVSARSASVPGQFEERSLPGVADAHPPTVAQEGGNQDKKRTIRAAARDRYALPVLAWTPLPRNPLRR